MSYFAERWPEWLALVGEHLWISGLALGAALLIAAPLGILCSARPWAERLATGLTGVLRVIPSLAVLIICVPILGVGDLPAVIALTVLAIPPILINTCVAFRSVPPAIIEAARGMGMSRAQLFFSIKAPLAFPLAFSGVRTAATEVIASASLAAYIGAGRPGRAHLHRPRRAQDRPAVDRRPIRRRPLPHRQPSARRSRSPRSPLRARGGCGAPLIPLRKDHP